MIIIPRGNFVYVRDRVYPSALSVIVCLCVSAATFALKSSGVGVSGDDHDHDDRRNIREANGWTSPGNRQ